jgi:hypothetical protein
MRVIIIFSETNIFIGSVHSEEVYCHLKYDASFNVGINGLCEQH